MLTYAWDGTADDRVHVSAIGGIRGYQCPEHRHRGFWELTLVRHGRLQHRFAGAWHDLPPGALVVLREQDAHALAGEGVEYLNVSFDTHFIRTLEPALRAQFAGDEPLHVQLSPARAAALEAETDAIAAAEGPLQVMLMVRLLAGVAADLYARKVAPSSKPAWLERLQVRLSRQDLPVPSLSEIRRAAGVSAEHLARTVQRQVGCTPLAWLHQCRLARGARLLAATDLPVALIAERCGYADAGHFHRRFRALHGLGPRDYRQREQRFVR